MKKVIFIAIAICSTVQANAQKRIRDFSLIAPATTMESSLYRSIEVIDDREFKDNLGIIQVGAFNSKAQVIPEIPLETQIQQQLDLLVLGDKGNGTLALLIHRFAVAEFTGAFSESGFFDFRADLFVKYEDQSYQKLATIDTAHVNKGMDVSKALLRHASHIVTDFLMNNLNRLPIDAERYSKTQLLDMEAIRKYQIPLYSNNILKDGLYLDYSHFRDQFLKVMFPSKKVILPKVFMWLTPKEN